MQYLNAAAQKSSLNFCRSTVFSGALAFF